MVGKSLSKYVAEVEGLPKSVLLEELRKASGEAFEGVVRLLSDGEERLLVALLRWVSDVYGDKYGSPVLGSCTVSRVEVL